MNILGMFARQPALGKTKTRLAASIGQTFTLNLYTAFLQDLFQLPAERAEQFVVAVTPPDDTTRDWFSRHLPDTAQITDQPDGNLGDRILWFFRTAFNQGADRVVLIGSDSPDLPHAIIDSAFDHLESTDLVASPAADGGYVLIGLSRQPGTLFDEILWSTGLTLLQTIQAAERQRFTVRLLQPWYDIDTVDSLGTLMALQQADDSIARPCPNTVACLTGGWTDFSAAAGKSDPSQA